MTTLYNMAPTRKCEMKQPKLDYSDLNGSFTRLDEYYRFYSIKEGAEKIARALIHADSSIIETVKEFDKKTQSWKRFKNWIYEKKKKRGLKNIRLSKVMSVKKACP